jgi:hypothetical protein
MAGDYHFPDLDGVDLWHFWEAYRYQGREHAISWLRANVAVPLRYQFDEEVDEDEYYESAVSHYVDVARTNGGALA